MCATQANKQKFKVETLVAPLGLGTWYRILLFAVWEYGSVPIDTSLF